MSYISEKKGVALLIAVLTLSVVLGVGLTIVGVVIKHLNITAQSRDSVVSIYSADSGIECALVWDIRGHEAGFWGADPDGDGLPNPVFATSADSVNFNLIPSSSNIDCSGTDISAIWNIGVGVDSATTTFELSLPQGCARVEVRKFDVSGVIQTTVRASGYNVGCNATTTVPWAVERAIRVRYCFGAGC